MHDALHDKCTKKNADENCAVRKCIISDADSAADQSLSENHAKKKISKQSDPLTDMREFSINK